MNVSNEAELVEAIRTANGPLRIMGGGTRGATGAEGAPLSVAGLNEISLYEPGALTIVAAAGTPISTIETALDAGGQRLAFEPMDYRALLGTTGEPTLGGAVASGASGPRRIVVGAVRDFCLGVRFVDGSGNIIKNGGRVMKNVTGYDLVKLMAGSRGTLGVLTEVALKVLPKPETEATLILHGLDIASAVQAMSAALGSPFEVTGVAHFPYSAGDDPATMIRLEGFEQSVRYRTGALKDLLGHYGEISIVEGVPSTTGWTRTRDVDMFADTPGDVWRISVRPSEAPAIIAQMGDGVRVTLDWGGGLIWALAPEGTDLRAALGPINGHATLVRASAATFAAIPALPPEPAPLAAISEGLRSRFDPRGLFSPRKVDA
ncbi:FAD-binding protein [Ponticoccus sp. SC2-23]|uniref:FAD-binding protein n=1 Tax=Alexandriicola marinus TaxID=2081710 RepID=UPI000FD8743B|nr:FAD-binding protein [Alexandriicola marinus]MBM1220283.1 FAD-binding protein [Ponticoccus sp. SC6-9]MBM1224969.1 FAD-binding protein [Ponticoccus sp. SC6-15]MBM1228483.1 FAD-binding protein [Ponticoccus sp. SC6-38]MBM1233880.1 FAD-binding protein [Ponticoccus sp. SC6-45]MBM1238984.1 FAD-binding protein [Ponticoccus sp. SC6-49]MBM1242766.1 FAD-binding protein [Ponticoccus sp. SC2-64]MBM1247404.1 FAD-binding protein [Ponticoccus sp. SC6-42]MBM1251937.1 FAD-binding protein [Ponticoccus sp. 